MTGGVQGLVLAGGAARRFGRDKVLERLEPEGPTMLEVALTALSPWCERLAVVRAHAEPALPSSFEERPLERLRDPGRGPLQALAFALEQRPARRWLVAAADLPRLRPEAYGRLLEAIGEGEAACFRRDDRLEPLVAVLSERAGARLRSSADRNPNAALQEAMRGLDILCLDATDDERAQLWNVNRPEDLPPPPSTPLPEEA